MEHYDIEDAFRRISAPTLELEWSISKGGGQKTGDTARSSIVVDVSIRNISKISARNCYVSTLAAIPRNVIVPNPVGVTVREQPPLRYYELDTAIINPGMARIIASVEMTYKMRQQADIWLLNGSIKRNLLIGYGCLDCAMQTKNISFTAEEVILNLDPAPIIT